MKKKKTKKLKIYACVYVLITPVWNWTIITLIVFTINAVVVVVVTQKISGQCSLLTITCLAQMLITSVLSYDNCRPSKVKMYNVYGAGLRPF